jgi:hypothetical protein
MKKSFLILALLLLFPVGSFAADAVSTQTVFVGNKRVIKHFTNVSDGTGESAVQKVDISALPGSPSAVRIDKVTFTTLGMSVRVLYDHATDDTAMVLYGSGEIDLKGYGGLHDPASSGGTGDILFTTIGQVANDSYDITLELEY